MKHNFTTTAARSYGTTDVFDSYNSSLLEFAAACFILFIVVGVPGNAITALALTRSRTVRNATAAFVVNLSVADLLFCLVNMPLAVSNFVHRGWVHGEWLCVVSAFLRYGNVGVSLLTVTAITLNRYASIVHPDRWPRSSPLSSPVSSIRRFDSSRMVAAMVAVIWLVAFGPLVPTLIGVWGRFGFDSKVGTCSIVAGRDGRSPKSVLFVVAFVLPCVVICLCYVRIFGVVSNSRHKTTDPRGGHHAEDDGTAARHRRTDLRLVWMILVIFGSFVLCNLPLTLVKVLGKEDEMKVLNVLGYLAMYASSCTNPIIYVAMSREYRRAYVELFAGCSNTGTRSYGGRTPKAKRTTAVHRTNRAARNSSSRQIR